jgi:hypothetical protein
MRFAAAFSCLLVSASLLSGCCKKPADDLAEPQRPTETTAVSATPSATPKAVAPAAATVQIAEQATANGFSPDNERWMKGFKFGLPSGAMTGQTWPEARQACLSVGRDLCSREQWLQACTKDATVGTVPTWTISSGSEKQTFVVRGGVGCASTSESPAAQPDSARVGLCCEKGAAISSTKKTEAWLKSADVYVRLVEDALNSSNPDQIVKLLDEPSKLFATTSSKAQALKNLRDDYKKYSEWKYRFTRCDADIDTYVGSFECDGMMTRVLASGKREMTAYRARFEYGEPKLSYKVFAATVKVNWPWAAY